MAEYFKRVKIGLWVIAISGLFITSCKNDSTIKPEPFGYEYFPLSVGNWVVYDVDSIYYDDFKGSIDTFNFQIREYVESKFKDNEGRTAFRIERYKRVYPSQSWYLNDVWYANRTSTTAEKVEENLRYVKMNFPVKGGKEWDGNRFNTLPEWLYHYEDLDGSGTYGGINFDTTVTVLQRDELNLIQKTYAVEVFAKHVGLIYKEIIDIHDKDSEIQPLPLINRVDSGLHYTMTINSYYGQ